MENEVKEPADKYNYISPEDYLAMENGCCLSLNNLLKALL